METLPVPVLKLPDKESFLCLDGQMYFLDKMKQKPQALFKELEAYYEDHLKDAKERIAHHIADASQTDLDVQLSRIERHLRQGIVTLPDDLREQGSIMSLWTNKVYPTRIVLFKPSRISMTLRRGVDYIAWFDSNYSARDRERFTKFYEYIKPLSEHFTGLNRDLSSVKIDIMVKQDLVIYPMVVSHIVPEKRIQVMPFSEHCHCYGDGRLCTGNAPAEAFWNDPGFLLNFNSINPHSFANSGGASALHHKEMFRNVYFQEGRVRESEGPWRV